MPNLTKLDKIRKVLRDARSRTARRRDNLSVERKNFKNGIGSQDDVSNAKTALDESLSTEDAISRQYFNERLLRDMDEATGDGRRFIDEVVNFVGPRQPYSPRVLFEKGGPRKVPQSQISQIAEITNAYNLSEVPNTVQIKFLDTNGKGMKPKEAYWSTNKNGIFNGKYWKNRYNDNFYVPDNCTDVCRP